MAAVRRIFAGNRSQTKTETAQNRYAVKGNFMPKKNDKTNAMRLLEAAGAGYTEHSFACPAALSGVEIATILNQDPACVFKTLVTAGKTGTHYVFMVPVAKELDLKKAAKTVGEKYIEMIPAKQLLPLTGYIHGGCSPLGMKKQFKTTIDESALLQNRIYFSGGRLGLQIETTLQGLQLAIEVQTADLCCS